MIQAKITNVYDADTCRAVFYLDNKLVKYTVRLKGIDTPEIRPKKV
jgi:endonuclease YncB( thermonuclease family)